MNGLWKHVTDLKPSGDHPEWDPAEEMLLGVLEVYTKKDIWITVSDDTKFKTCKEKWEELQHVYGGVGSMSTFNIWLALTGT